MRLRQTPVQKQILSLKQVLSPKMIQLFKSFQMDYLQFSEKIKKEKEGNVFIEMTHEDRLSYRMNNNRKGSASHDYSGNETGNVFDTLYQEKTLHEHLLDQLSTEHLSKRDHEIGAQLIEGLDNRGYLLDGKELISKLAQQFHVQTRKIKRVLNVIQSFEPDGVGAQDLKESLLIQLHAYEFEHKALVEPIERVIKTSLDLIGDGDLEGISKLTKIELEAVEQIVQFIKENFTPNPGNCFVDSEKSVYVVPSFKVVEKEGAWQFINLEKTEGVQIHIVEKSIKLLEDPHIDSASKKFLKEQYERAKTLQDQILQRGQNIQRIAVYILKKQSLFLKYGKSHIIPLLQKELATDLGLSASTISRIVANKYIDTPHGMLGFKQLCPRGYFGKTSERLGQIVAQTIKENWILSDQKITDLLKKKGINLARRTVTKYRLSQGMKSSYQRDK